MAKGKSSASSATRKKHARKAANAAGELDEPQLSKEKKQKKEKGSKRSKEPRKKVYIPPSKPVPVQPDPLDTLGIAQRIPAELLVVLRKLGKKDSVTKRRALEDLQADWVEKCRHDENVAAVLEDVLPVWLHHVPALFTHSSRRVRQLAVNLHAALLARPTLANAIALLLHEGTSSDNADFILGSWLLATCDVDRQVSGVAKPSWNSHITTRPSSSHAKIPLGLATFSPLWEFVQRVLLDPSGVYLQINPPQPILPLSAPQSRKGSGKNTPVPKRNEELTPRIKDEDEENEADRKARLRIGGFGALEWMMAAQSQMSADEAAVTAFLKPLDNIALWSALYHGQHAPFLDDDFEAFGWNQPGVRRACWTAIQALLRVHKVRLYGLEQALSTAALRSAWVEPDTTVRSSLWQPLLTLLKEHPTAWELEARGPSDADADDEDSSSDGEEDVVAPKPIARKVHTEQKLVHSHAYDEFRQFLELGCMGSPVEAYPAIIIVLSTISPQIFATAPTPVETFFNSFWAAVDGRALSGLDRLTASAAFLSSILECMVFIVRRLIGEQGKLLLSDDQVDGRETARELIREQIRRCWEELSTERLKLDQSEVARIFTKSFVSLQQLDEEFFTTAWGILSNAIKVQLITSLQGVPSLVPALLKGVRSHSPKQSKLEQANDQLISDVVYSSIMRFEEILNEDASSTVDQSKLSSLVAILNAFGDVIFADDGLTSAIDTTCSKHAYRLLSLCPDVLFVYLAHRGDEERCVKLWQDVLATIAGHEEATSTTLEPLLRAAESGQLSASLRPAGDELDAFVGQLLVAALSGKIGSAESLDILKRVLTHYANFIKTECLRGIASSITTTFAQHAQSSFREEGLATPSLSGLLALLQTITKGDILPAVQDDVTAVLPDLFLFAYVPSAIRSPNYSETQCSTAGDIFALCLANVDLPTREHVAANLQQRLQDIILDCSIAIKPSRLLRTVSQSTVNLHADLVSGVFPGQREFDKLLGQLPSYPHPSIAVVDSLVLLGDYDDEDTIQQPELDLFGYSSYARIVSSLLLHFLDNRDAARENVWALRHFQALALYAKDVLQVPSAQSAVFGRDVDRADLDDLISKVDQLSAYTLTHLVDDGWFSRIIPLLSAGKAAPSSDRIALLLESLLQPRDGDSVRESRILHSILRHVLAGVTKADADQLIVLARSIEKKAPRASLAVVFSVTQYAPEPPRLDRLRNELAAGIMGVPPAKANTEGLWMLRRLAAVAPDPESDIVYLPTPRAVNLMKACQQWIASDEDLDEEVEYQMTTVFIHLAPILQTVPGAHWDLIFDLAESNLENSSFSDSTTLPLLHRTLQLVLAIEELASTNRALRADWQERRNSIFTLVRDLVVQKSDGAKDMPLSMCRELALTAIQDLPESLVDRQSISQMCHLLMDASDNVPKMSYKILQSSAAKYTEHLVLEASVESESAVPLELPPELVQLLLQSSLVEDELPESVRDQHLFGNMLAWMLAFDLFTNASLKVKIEYINHLKREGLIVDYFLPQIFTVLGLYDGVARAFKLDIWAIDEYYLDLTYTDTPLRLPLLAAHLYYRALRIVPGLIRSWLADCRDRQLNSTVTAYTSSHFSPAIIRAELAQAKDPVVAAELADENLKIKVASTVHEVTASYTVDEYELELRIRLPSDWPLHAVEVTDTAHVGVSEDRWRSWVLGVQQILTFRGGSVVDGLAFFKKNVVSHFEGQSECAICYSMISAMDGTLPKKPCKTCKNKFHSGCLYKWFNSSHSSSCPLCRSEIIQ